MNKRNILFIGGDERQLYCAKKLYESGYEVSLFGFENYPAIPSQLMVFHNLKIAVILADVIILPTPFTYNAVLFAPYSQMQYKKEDILKYLSEEKIVFGGKYDAQAADFFAKKKIRSYDLLEQEDITLSNAYLTAEGTVEKMMQLSPAALFNQSVLIIGFGRIAKGLVRYLNAFKMNITVAARKKSDLTLAKLMGAKAKPIAHLRDFGGYDFIINTVPVRLFDASAIETLAVPYIDLGYKGNYRNEHYCVYSGVPGKYAPASAGELIAAFVQKQLKEGEDE